MATLDDILNMFKDMKLTGNESGEDLQNLVSQQATPSAQPVSVSDNAIKPPTFSDVNSVPSSFDTSISDNTVTQNGNTPSLAAPAPSPVIPPQPSEPTPSPVTSVPLPPPTAAPTTSKPAITPKQEPVEKPTAPANISGPSDADVRAKGLADLEHRRKMSVIPAAIAGAGDAIGSGLAAFGVKVPTDQQEKLLDRAKANFEESKGLLEEKISNDPNSDASKTARALVLQIAPQMAKNPDFHTMSDKMLRDKLPLVDTMMKAQAAKDARELAVKQMALQRQLAANTKLDETTVKRFKQLGDDLDPSRFRAGNFAVAEQTFNRAEKLQSLANAYKDSNLDSRQLEELAIGLNAMLSGSNVGAQQQVKALVPSSVWGNAQKMTEFLTNNPRGTQQQEFVKRILGTIDREKNTAEDQMNRTRFSRIAKYKDLEQKDPETFNSILQSNQVNPDKYKEWKDSGYKFKSAVQSPEDQPKGSSKTASGTTYSVRG